MFALKAVSRAVVSKSNIDRYIEALKEGIVFSDNPELQYNTEGIDEKELYKLLHALGRVIVDYTYSLPNAFGIDTAVYKIEAGDTPVYVARIHEKHYAEPHSTVTTETTVYFASDNKYDVMKKLLEIFKDIRKTVKTYIQKKRASEKELDKIDAIIDDIVVNHIPLITPDDIRAVKGFIKGAVEKIRSIRKKPSLGKKEK